MYNTLISFHFIHQVMLLLAWSNVWNLYLRSSKLRRKTVTWTLAACNINLPPFSMYVKTATSSHGCWLPCNAVYHYVMRPAAMSFFTVYSNQQMCIRNPCVPNQIGKCVKKNLQICIQIYKCTEICKCSICKYSSWRSWNRLYLTLPDLSPQFCVSAREW